LQWTHNGAVVAGHRFAALSEAIGDWQGLYDLLPRTPTVWMEEERVPLYPWQLAERPDNTLSSKRATDALTMHRDIEQAWEELYLGPRLACPEIATVVSTGHGTPVYASVGNGGLDIHKRLPARLEGHLPAIAPDSHGDGKVPTQSTVPLEEERHGGASGASRHLSSNRHGALGDATHPAAILRHYLEGGPRGYRGITEKTPSLGTDIDQFCAAGTAPEISAALRDADPSGVDVWASIGPVDAGRPEWEGRMEYDGDGWRLRLPSLAPGMYRLRLDALGVPEAGELSCTEDITALELT
jgi:hypothetical protein